MALRDERPDHEHLQALLRVAASRRDFGRFVAVAAGLTGLVPTLPAAAAGVPGHRSETRAAAQGDAPKQGGQIVVGRAGDADTLDPHHTLASVSWQTYSNIFDPLVAWTLDRQYEGILAESWEFSADGLELTFHLRQGITFHDGTDFNADAVKFTFDRILDPATQSPLVGFLGTDTVGMKGTEVVDPSTVKITLKGPFSPLLNSLSLANFGILSPTAVQTLGDDFGKKPVGTGPFKFKEWVAGESITLERNPDYQNFHSYDTNKGAPNVDALVFRNLPEEQTRLAAFETGEINLLPGVPAHQVAGYKDNPDVELFTAPGTDIAFLEFAMSPPDATNGAIFKPPFDDIRVRQAVAQAIDVDTIIARVLEGLAVRNYGPLPAGNAGYNPDVEQFGYHYDADAANKLLDDAGWVKGDGGVRSKNGETLKVVFWTWSGGNEERAAQVIQNDLTKVGFDVKFETMEVATFLSRLVEPDSPCTLDLDEWGWPEPDLLFLMSTVNAAFGYYHQPDYYKLISDARAVSDLDRRVQMYFEAMKLMLQDAAMVPLWTTTQVTAARKEVTGFKLGPLAEILDYQDVSIEG
ncbi:MAG TPA: ABC transporter substrate-binding protein [Thermomicrobiales bacterium]|jgi:peptide/nickel transport system substrate-binding protein